MWQWVMMGRGGSKLEINKRMRGLERQKKDEKIDNAVTDCN